MRLIYLLTLIVSIANCTGRKASLTSPAPGKAIFNQALVEQLAKMAQLDQIASYIPQGKYKQMSPAQWDAFKDSVFTTHQRRVEAIFNQYGYLGFDLVGEEGSKNFYLLVQHADHDPEFQQQVLEKMEIEVQKGNAQPQDYAFLVDRVNLNTGKRQVYGTQVTYNLEICQAYPKPLADSASVNQRRKTFGLPPLEEHLNQMTQAHFEMNKEGYLKKGIKEPKLYKTDQASR